MQASSPPPPLVPIEMLAYGGIGSGTAHLRAGALYRLCVPAITLYNGAAAARSPSAASGPGAVARGRPAESSRLARVTISAWPETVPGALPSPPDFDARADTAEDLGVSIALSAYDGFTIKGNPSLGVDLHIGVDGLALAPMKFKILCSSQYGGRPLALRAHWADDRMPLPGTQAVRFVLGGEAARSSDETLPLPRPLLPPVPSLMVPVPPAPAALGIASGHSSPSALGVRRRSPRDGGGGAAGPRRRSNPTIDAGLGIALAPPSASVSPSSASRAAASPTASLSTPSPSAFRPRLEIVPPVGPVGATISGAELRGGAFLGVARSLRELPVGAGGVVPPLSPVPAQRGQLPPEEMAAAALSAVALSAGHAGSRAGTPTPHGAAPGPGAPLPPAGLEALAVAQEVASLGLGLKPPPGPGGLCSLISPVHENQEWLSEVLGRTREELGRRGGRHAALAPLAALARLLSDLEAADQGKEAPLPPAPSPSLFAMDALTAPDEARAGCTLPEWRPMPVEAPELDAFVAQAFESLRFAGSAAAVAAAATAATHLLLEDRLLLSPLVRTSEGRTRLRALLVALREHTASMSPVLHVASSLADQAIRRLRHPAEHREDAVLTAARDVAQSAGGPFGVDVLPNVLYAEALVRLGELMVVEGHVEEGLQTLFDAWSVVLRAGACPSRLESRIILLLAEGHFVHPTAFQLGERVYWCTQNVEDRHQEARACNLLAALAASAGRLEEARAHVDRVFEIQLQLPPHEQEREAAGYLATSTAVPMALRAGRTHECFELARTAHAIYRRLPDAAHAAGDVVTGGFRAMHRFPHLLPAYAEAARFALFLSALADPEESTPTRFLALCGLGEVYARQGAWRRAAVAYGAALEASARHRRSFPLDHPRILRVTEAVRRCRELSEAVPLPLSFPGPPTPVGELHFLF
eukprot:tig00001487_g8940.t1